jgi:hypothetical protein
MHRVFALLILSGCTAAPAEASAAVTAAPATAAYTDVLIEGVPHVRQKPDFCGEACVEMVLRKHRLQIDQDEVFNRSGVDPASGRGCFAPDLVRAVRAVGFDPGAVWKQVATKRADTELEALWKELHEDLVAGVPSIVCMRYDARPKTSEHFRLVLGYDAKKDEVIYHEPAVDKASYRRMKRALFLDLWPLKYSPDRWTVIRLRLDGSKLPKSTPKPRFASGKSESRFSRADFAQHVLALKEKLPSKDFTVLVEPPFIVVGDEFSSTVRRRSKNTVAWAVERLKASYFREDPLEIIDVWLFKNKESYRRNVRKLWDDEPSTPFGYYSSTNKALVMNIATGGGTLVHEIVHPFIEANFPACPSWFNEGLASLYEQCGERGGKIVGFTNWRLEGLQDAIRVAAVPTFATLTSTTTHQFYNEDPGTNYSQARYLCYYLQEKALLRKFYRSFSADVKKDPTGFRTLKSVLREKDMADFKKRWERSVLALRFR